MKIFKVIDKANKIQIIHKVIKLLILKKIIVNYNQIIKIVIQVVNN